MNHPNGPIRPIPDPPQLPPGGPCVAVLDSDDVAVPALVDHVTYHRTGPGLSPCGQLPMANAVQPFPGLWRVKRDFFGSPCQPCYAPTEVLR